MSDNTYGDILANMRAFFKTGATLPIEWRREQLAALKRCIFENQDALIEAVDADLSKCRSEARLTEFAQMFAEIEFAEKKLASWMKPESLSAASFINSLDTIQVRKDPLGVCLLIVPWNYPVALSILPMISMLAAGNTVVLKPSEVSATVAGVLAEIIPQYFAPEIVSVVTGGVEETTELLKLRYDHISYTGSTNVARIIMAAAAKHLTPVTLELGGKSPAIVTPNANIAAAARRIVWGRLINCGQSCIAPDYVLVPPELEAELIENMEAAIVEFYSESPKESPDYGRIINTRHWDRLMRLLEPGEFEVVTGGPETADRDDKFIPPTILRGVSPDAPVMQEEIFGPILPVLTVADLDAAIEFVNDREKPLALYVFSSAKADAEQVLTRTSSGSVCINDTVIQHGVITLPFGGVGESGMGFHHGKWGFEEFSHTKAVLGKSSGLEGLNSTRYPPYTDAKMSKVEWAVGYPKTLEKSSCSLM